VKRRELFFNNVLNFTVYDLTSRILYYTSVKVQRAEQTRLARDGKMEKRQ
jgi:hypothetical protein